MSGEQVADVNACEAECKLAPGQSSLVFQAFLVVASIALGILGTVYLLGWRTLDPRNVNWLVGDPIAFYIGFDFLRHEEVWTFPLTWSSRLGYPVGTSVALLDIIPLILVVLRPFSSWLPSPFQYVGLYSCLTISLQAYFGFRLFSLLGRGEWSTTIFGGLFIVLAPVLTWRFFGHFALTSQWLIIAALLSYFKPSPNKSIWRWFMPFLILLVLAGGINAYLSFMCLTITAAACGRLWLEKRVSFMHSLSLFVLSLAVVLLSLVFFGVLIIRDLASYGGGEYGLYYSMNLVSLFDPEAESLLFKIQPLRTGQIEGYNYLGLGVIVLLAGAIYRRSWSAVDFKSSCNTTAGVDGRFSAFRRDHYHDHTGSADHSILATAGLDREHARCSARKRSVILARSLSPHCRCRSPFYA